jgi:hypothetical protein
VACRRPQFFALMLSLAACTVAGRGDGPALPGVRTFVLEEIAAFPLPAAFPVAGMAIGSNGGVAAWPASGDLLLLIDPDFTTSQTLHVGADTRILAAAFLGDSTLEVATSDWRIIHYPLLRNQRPFVTRLSGRGSMVAAGRTEAGWVVLWNDPNRGLRVAFTNDRSRRLPGGLLRGSQFESMVVREDVLIFTQGRAPWQSIAYYPDEDRVLAIEPPPELLEVLQQSSGVRPDAADEVASIWRSQSLLPLDRGYLQTLADLTSDRRTLILYDQSGRATRTRHIDVAIGFSASLPERGWLLAARRTNAVEVIKYRWHWEAEQRYPERVGRSRGAQSGSRDVPEPSQ